MLKVVLINPAPDYSHEEAYDKADYPNLTICQLAGAIESITDVLLLDMKYDRLNLAQVITEIKKHFGLNVDMVGITSYTQEILLSAQIMKEIKTHLNIRFSVVGGVHTSFLKKETLEEFPIFDLLVFGEGEDTLIDLVKEIQENGGKDFSWIKGLAWRLNGNVVVNPARPVETNLDNLPLPAYHLLKPASCYRISTARGCPYGCYFCSRPYGNKVRNLSPEKFREMLYTLPKTAKHIEFNDETFAMNYKRTLEICNIMKEWGGIWGVESRINIFKKRPELLKIMRDAGLVGIGFGIESADRNLRKSQNKDFSNKEARNVVQQCKKLGITTGTYFIFGHPNETFYSAMKTVLLALYIGADFASLGIMVPLPGTLVREMAMKGEGGYRLTSNGWSFYGKQHGHALEFKNVSRRMIERLQNVGYFLLFLRNPIKKAKYAWSRRSQILFMLSRHSNVLRKLLSRNYKQMMIL